MWTTKTQQPGLPYICHTFSKLHTLYRFLAIHGSPNTQRKESLFFEPVKAHLRTLLSQSKGIISLYNCPSNPLDRSEDQGSHSQDAGSLLKQRQDHWSWWATIPLLLLHVAPWCLMVVISEIRRYFKDRWWSTHPALSTSKPESDMGRIKFR